MSQILMRNKCIQQIERMRVLQLHDFACFLTSALKRESWMSISSCLQHFHLQFIFIYIIDKDNLWLNYYWEILPHF